MLMIAVLSFTVVVKIWLWRMNTKVGKETGSEALSASGADALKVPYVAIIGETELAAGTVTLKNMTDGTQKQVSVSGLAEAII